MANHRQRPDTNGPQNGTSVHGASSSHMQPTRPLTLRESLPYSPQLTTLPFIPDLVPNPVPGSGSPSLKDSELFTQYDLENINREAGSPGHVSKNMKQATENVLHELKPTLRTQYKFRPVTRLQTASNPRASLSQDLSPMAKTIYERVGDYFKATKPNAASPSTANGPTKGQPKSAGKAQPIPRSNAAAAHTSNNSQAHKSNAVKIEAAIPPKQSIEVIPATNSTAAPVPKAETTNGTFDPNTLASIPVKYPAAVPVQDPMQDELGEIHVQGPKPGFRIELPSSTINRGEYFEVAEAIEAPQNLSRPKQPPALENSQGVIGESLDHRQRAQSALTELQRRIESILGAVQAVFNGEPGYDHLVYLTSDQEPTITGDEQRKLHTSIQKVIGLGCFDRVPVEALSQILRLSEGSLKEAIAADLQLDKEGDESSASTWVQQLPVLETALKAARTSMRILSGGREDRQLYSESVIENSVKVFQKTADDIIGPLVELRNSGPSASIFKILAKQKKEISPLFVSCQKLLGLLAELVLKVQLSELAINTLEFVASNLIFVDNAYYEKDSLVGVQKFDGIRSAAMDTLCQIFLVKPAQRQGILNEILTSLSKLPGNKQSSKQYKLSDGGSIQPVSALIMRLVQASSARPEKEAQYRNVPTQDDENSDGDQDADELQMKPQRAHVASSINDEHRGAEQPDIAMQELGTFIQAPMEDAQRNAVIVINFLVQRAVGSSRSGETPFRNILDHCVDDFTVCLESIDWPSAELLLRCLMNQMVHLFEGERTPAPVKNMALEILGNMSAAISRLCSQVKKTANSSEGAHSDELSQFLSDLANQALDREVQPNQVVSWTGPYRVALEYLESQASNDSHLASASAYLMNIWASRARACFESLPQDAHESDGELGRLAYRLRMMVEDRAWLSSQFEFNAVSLNQAKLAYSVVLLGSPLCESFERIFSMLLGSMSSDQATVRSKSLKSVNTVLETDPSILDRNPMIIDRILECSRDLSSLVREATLGLMGNCIQMRPKLESSFIPHIMERVSDAGVSVRRRAMKLARDIYLRNKDRNLRSHIASGLLRRVISDLDDGVKETAKQMVEEIWFAPFYQMDDTAVFQTSLAEHTVLIIRTVRAGGVSDMLDKVLQSILKSEKKGANGPFDVCAKLVFNLFGHINNPEAEDSSVPSGRDALHVLTIFARADPKLFTFEQMRLLRPHLASSESPEDLATFRAVVAILTCVLPQLSAVHTDFITELKNTLLPKMGKIDQRPVLQDLGACIRVVLDLLGTLGPIVSLAKSVLVGVHRLQPPHRMQGVEIRKLRLFAWLLGIIAQHFDLDSQLDVFKATFKDFKGDTVARLMVDKLTPFTSTAQDPETRRTAVEGIAAVCQAWPRNYTLPKVWTVFQQAFQDRDQKLENLILLSFKEFLLTEEKRSEASSKADGTEKKSLTVMGGTSYDDVASATTQRFLKEITRISLATQDGHALLALEVLASINRQGLTHPKETGVTLITLETSSNPKIAELAYQEHRALHEKHESTVEREYTKAVQSAYEYQRDVANDTRGATLDPPQAKLHNMMDVLKISKIKNRQRFFEKLVALFEFDMATLDVEADPPPHLDFCRFVAENIAFFEYQAVGELQTVVHKMEQLVSTAGTSVAQVIEIEILNNRMDVNMDAQIQQQLNENEPHGQEPEVPVDVDPRRLRELATAAIILLLIWEVRTHLRRLYGMGAHRHDSKAKALAKDLNRAPTKTQGIHWDKFWEEISALPNGLQTPEYMVKACKALVEMMSVDKDIRVADGDDDMDIEGPSTPSEDDDDQGDRGRKRKNASTPGGRKKRARSGSQPRKRGRPRKNPAPAEQSMDPESDIDWV